MLFFKILLPCSQLVFTQHHAQGMLLGKYSILGFWWHLHWAQCAATGEARGRANTAYLAYSHD